MYNNEEEIINKKYDNSLIKSFMNGQKNSPFRYTLEEIIDAESNQVINHLFTTKPYGNKINKKNGKIWVNYAKMTRSYEKLKQEFPQVFQLFDI